MPLRLVMFALLSGLLSAGASHAQSVGYVAGLTGTVEIQPGGSGSFQAAATDTRVELGDVIRTGPGSAVKVLLEDDTILSLGEETEIAVDSLVAGSTLASGGEPSVLRLLRGRVRTRVGEAFGGPTRLELHTPTAVAGVKGTDFETDHDATRAPEVTQVCTWQGNIFTRSDEPTRPREEDVAPGYCRDVAAGQSPSKAYPIPADYQSVGPGPSSGAAAAAGLIAAAGGEILLTQLLLEAPDVAVGPEGVEFEDLDFDPDVLDPVQGGEIDDVFDDMDDMDDLEMPGDGDGFVDPSIPPFVDPSIPPDDVVLD